MKPRPKTKRIKEHKKDIDVYIPDNYWALYHSIVKMQHTTVVDKTTELIKKFVEDNRRIITIG